MTSQSVWLRLSATSCPSLTRDIPRCVSLSFGITLLCLLIFCKYNVFYWKSAFSDKISVKIGAFSYEHEGLTPALFFFVGFTSVANISWIMPNVFLLPLFKVVTYHLFICLQIIKQFQGNFNLHQA